MLKEVVKEKLKDLSNALRPAIVRVCMHVQLHGLMMCHSVPYVKQYRHVHGNPQEAGDKSSERKQKKMKNKKKAILSLQKIAVGDHLLCNGSPPPCSGGGGFNGDEEASREEGSRLMQIRCAYPPDSHVTNKLRVAHIE